MQDDRRRDVGRHDEREGFWGRGHRGSGFDRPEEREYSREDYGRGEAGTPRGVRDPYSGSFGRHGEEGVGGRGYGRFRDDLGAEGSGRGFAGNEGRGFGYGSDYRENHGGGQYGGGDRGREGYGLRGREERGLFARAADEVSSWFGDEGAERRRQEDHRGRGPKGYRRTDARIQEDVNDRLADDSYLDASDVEVAVENGEVTLSGLVDSRQARRRAEDLAEQVSGVSYVQNNLRVRSLGSATTHGSRAPASDLAGQMAAGDADRTRGSDSAS